MTRPPRGKTPKERLIAARVALGYESQEAFAAALGEERALIGKYESAAGNEPGDRLLYKLEEILGVSRRWILEGRGGWRVDPARRRELLGLLGRMDERVRDAAVGQRRSVEKVMPRPEIKEGRRRAEAWKPRMEK